VGYYIWYSEEGTGRGRIPSRLLFAVQNVTVPLINGKCTNHRIAVYGPLLCGFSMPIKGLISVVRSSLDNTCSASWSAASNNRRVVVREAVEPCRTCPGRMDRSMSVSHCETAASTPRVSSHALHDRLQALVRLL